MIQEELKALSDPRRAVSEQAYLKSDLTHLGVPVPVIRKVVKVDLKRSRPSREETVALAEALWVEPVHEFRMAAIEVLRAQVALLESADVALAERLIRDSRTWAYVDELAEKVIGVLVLRDPALATVLDGWLTDPNFWIRRTTLLALLPGVRTGNPDLARISRYGDTLITETEFFIRKALGWILRELSKTDPDWVIAWAEPRIPAMSGVTFREVVRRLPAPDQARLTLAYKSR